MTMEEEVTTTYKMLKENGFKVKDMIFEGGFSVRDHSALSNLQKWSDQGKAFGVVHVIYATPEGEQRVIDIPTSELEEERGETVE